MVCAFFVFLFILYLQIRAAKTKKPSIRRLAALDYMEEGVSRAAEMGRPVLVTVVGVLAADSRSAISGLSITSYLAHLCAAKGVPLIATAYNPDVYTIMDSNIKAAYIAAGRSEDIPKIHYIGDKLGWMGANLGIINREKPSMVNVLGTATVECIHFFEASHNAGAIVVGGTDQRSQFPFYPTVCDFTLLGEELYAAGAYLSGVPEEMGCVKAEDYIKGSAIILILMGVIFAIAKSDLLYNLLRW